VMEI